MRNRYFKIFLGFVVALGLLALSLRGHITKANADTLVIKDDGAIILVIENVVLGTTAENPQKPTRLEVSAKNVDIAPPHTERQIKITASPNNNKKVEVTITQKPPTPPSGAKTSVSTTPPPSTTPTTPVPPPVTKEVDQVVAQGSKGQVVLSVSPSGNNGLTVQQGDVKVASPLPLEVNSASHSLSLIAPTGAEKISVLPTVALDNVLGKGLINKDETTQKPNVSIDSERNEAVYKIEGEKKINFFGITSINLPITVKLSAQTGKITQNSFDILRLFRR